MGLKLTVKNNNIKTVMLNKAYFKDHIRCLQAVGLWPLDIWQNKTLVKWTTFAWYTLWQFVSIHITLLHIITLTNRFKKGGTLDDFSGVLMSTIIYGFTYFITMYFQLRHKSIRALIKYLCDNVRIRSAYGISYLTIEPSYLSMYQKTRFWVVICILGTLHWSVTPILTSQKILPLDLEYPFDTAISPRYEFLYFFQVLGQIQVGLAFGISSGVFMSAVIIVSGQFDLLFCSLKNLRNTAIILNEDYETLKILQDLYNPVSEEQSQYEHGGENFENLEIISRLKDKDLLVDRSRENNSPIRKLNIKPKDNYLLKYRDELHIALVDCTRHHQIINKMIQLTEDTYWPFAFVKLFQISFLICFLTFIVSKTPEINMQVVNLLEYLSLTLSELLLFCYFGELISRQSVRITDAIRRSSWYLCNGSLRRSLVIMMSCSKDPIRLTGGKFYTLNIETFCSVFTASFSYYTLLKNIGEH